MLPFPSTQKRLAQHSSSALLSLRTQTAQSFPDIETGSTSRRNSSLSYPVVVVLVELSMTSNQTRGTHFRYINWHAWEVAFTSQAFKLKWLALVTKSRLIGTKSRLSDTQTELSQHSSWAFPAFELGFFGTRIRVGSSGTRAGLLWHSSRTFPILKLGLSGTQAWLFRPSSLALPVVELDFSGPRAGLFRNSTATLLTLL